MICPCCGKRKRPNITPGLGTSLKPAMEPIAVLRKPISEKTIALNVLAHGTGALNIDGCRIDGPPRTTTGKGVNRKGAMSDGWGMRNGFESLPPSGRWPANLIHDGSEEVLAGFPESDSTRQNNPNQPTLRGGGEGSFGLGRDVGRSFTDFGDSGSAARFFYCAKATTEERGEGNGHPTVKPIDLMRWLCRLVTPAGGTVLDPFAGSGSTLIAADAEQFNAIGCELSPEYAATAERRLRASAGMFAEVRAA